MTSPVFAPALDVAGRRVLVCGGGPAALAAIRALLEAGADDDADWLAVQVEATRRIRTDARFRAQVRRLERETATRRPERYSRLSAFVRDDVPIEVVAQFLGMLANGAAFARASDDPLPDLDLLMTLVETGVAPRARPSSER